MRRYAVIGLGQFGRQLAISLTELGAEVLALDMSEKSVEWIRDRVAQAAVIDARDDSTLAGMGVAEMDTVVVAMAEDLQASVLITALLHEMGVKRIVARASSTLHEKILTMIGAHTVYNPEKDFAISVAHEIEEPSLRSRMVLATGHRVVEIEATQSLCGKTLLELDFRNRYRLNIIAIRRERTVVGRNGEMQVIDETNDLPAGEDRIEKGDILVVLGHDENLSKLEEGEG